MKKYGKGSDAEHFSPRATLAATGLKLIAIILFSPFEEKVKINQKIVKHSPPEKLYDAFIPILAGAHGDSRDHQKLGHSNVQNFLKPSNRSQAKMMKTERGRKKRLLTVAWRYVTFQADDQRLQHRCQS